MSYDLAYKQSQQQKILERLRANQRTKLIHVAAPKDCLVGQSIQGVYDKDEVPELPHRGCSRPGGCICSYVPVIIDIYP
jgi:hypothetical protein